jgi:hypothetical protein
MILVEPVARLARVARGGREIRYSVPAANQS